MYTCIHTHIAVSLSILSLYIHRFSPLLLPIYILSLYVHILSHFSLSLYRFSPLLLPIEILSIYVYICRCMYMYVRRYPWVGLPYSICCVLQCVADCCSVLQCVADCCSVFWWPRCLFAKAPVYYRHSPFQIGWPKILRFFRKTFNLVPGEPGFS